MSDEALFALFFAQIAGWQYHPGSGHGEHKIKTLDESVLVALEMLRLHRIIFPGS
nr:MAG: hypothetical protein [Microviridae sp.]